MGARREVDSSSNEVKAPKKKAFTKSKKFPKTRTGCSSCKQRKKKCNEARPICSTCKRLKSPCSYLTNFQWHTNHQLVLNQKDLKHIKQYSKRSFEDSTSYSNKVFGEIDPYYYHNVIGNNRMNDKLDQESSDYYVHFINVTRWDVSLAYHFNASHQLAEDLLPRFHYESLMPEYELKKMFEMSELTKNSSFSKLDEPDKQELIRSYGLDEKFLFNFFHSKLVNGNSHKANSNTTTNTNNHEFQTIIEKSYFESHALYNSILAYSAQMLLKNSFHKLDTQNSNTHLSICYYLSFKYKNLSINYLHDLVDSLDFNSVSIKVYEELLTTIIMLCSMDISYTGSISWVNHLKESCLLFSTIPKQDFAHTVLNNKLLLFAYKYIALRYILLSTTMKDDKLRSFLISSPFPIIREVFQNDMIDQMFGCSPRLLYMIYKLTVLEYEEGFNSVPDGLYHSINEQTPESLEYPLNLQSEHDDNRLNVKYLMFWNELIELEQFSNSRDIKSTNLLLISKSYYYSLKIFFINLLIVNKRIKLFMNKSKIDFLNIYYTHLFPESLKILEEIMKLQINEELQDYHSENEENTPNSVDEESPSSDFSSSLFTSMLSSSSTSTASLGTVSISFPLWSILIISILITNTNNTEEKELIRLKILHILKFLEIRDPLSSIFRLKRAIGIVWKVTDLSNNNSRMSSVTSDETKEEGSDSDDDIISEHGDVDNDVDNDDDSGVLSKSRSRVGSISEWGSTSNAEYTLYFNYKFDWRDILIEAGFNLALT